VWGETGSPAPSAVDVTVGDGSRRGGWIVAGLALLGLFAALTVLVGTRRLVGVDGGLMRAIHVASGRTLDVAAGLMSYSAAAEVTTGLMVLLSIWLWRRGTRWPIAAAPLLFLLSVPLELTLKTLLNQPPPSEYYRETIAYGLMSVPVMHSFPSGHAARTAFMCVLVGNLLGRRLGWLALLFGLGLLAGLSRAYLGYHWPSDVLGGYLLGGGLGCLGAALIGRPWAPRPV
jgi:membrane-associated phospholipid phosphatase